MRSITYQGRKETGIMREFKIQIYLTTDINFKEMVAFEQNLPPGFELESRWASSFFSTNDTNFRIIGNGIKISVTLNLIVFTFDDIYEIGEEIEIIDTVLSLFHNTFTEDEFHLTGEFYMRINLSRIIQKYDSLVYNQIFNIQTRVKQETPLLDSTLIQEEFLHQYYIKNFDNDYERILFTNRSRKNLTNFQWEIELSYNSPSLSKKNQHYSPYYTSVIEEKYQKILDLILDSITPLGISEFGITVINDEIVDEKEDDWD